MPLSDPAPRSTRRRFLVGAAAAAAAAATGCATRGDGAAPDAAAAPGDLAAGASTTTTSRPVARLTGDPFLLGVASGDPLPDRTVLWTRLAPAPLAGGLAGMPDHPVEVSWEVAVDDRFTRVVAGGVATAEPAAAHSVHVDATGLAPGTDYHYRFRVGEWTSPVGRTRTAAAPGEPLDRLTLAVANCQWFETGAYGAYRHMLDEDVDLVVHLGDYIYEYPNRGLDRRVAPEGPLVSLDDFRLRYASYRTDPHLQAAHARYPFMAIWDDHEVANDYAGDTVPDPLVPAESVRALRAAAYRAYWEHMPVRIPPPFGSDVPIHRAATFGDLARLYLLDERQHADEPACRRGSVDDIGDCADRLVPEREYLGPDQQAWFSGQVAAGGVAWNLVGNPIGLAPIDLGAAGAPPAYRLVSWDGYPAARRRFLESLVVPGATPVILSGDFHRGMVNDVRLDPADPASPVVATELMSPAISSPAAGPARIGAARNPHVQHQVLGNGYLRVTVEPERVTTAFRVLDDVADEWTGISTDSTWQITAGDPRARRV